MWGQVPNNNNKYKYEKPWTNFYESCVQPLNCNYSYAGLIDQRIFLSHLCPLLFIQFCGQQTLAASLHQCLPQWLHKSFISCTNLKIMSAQLQLSTDRSYNDSSKKLMPNIGWSLKRCLESHSISYDSGHFLWTTRYFW